MSGEFTAQVEVLAVGLLEGGVQCPDLAAVLLLELVDLLGQGQDEGALRVGRLWSAWRASLSAEVFDASAQVGVVVEEGVGDSGFTLHGLEGDGLAALDQLADRLFGGGGLGLGLGAGGGGEYGDAPDAGSVMGGPSGRGLSRG